MFDFTPRRSLLHRLRGLLTAGKSSSRETPDRPAPAPDLDKAEALAKLDASILDSLDRLDKRHAEEQRIAKNIREDMAAKAAPKPAESSRPVTWLEWCEAFALIELFQTLTKGSDADLDNQLGDILRPFPDEFHRIMRAKGIIEDVMQRASGFISTADPRIKKAIARIHGFNPKVPASGKKNKPIDAAASSPEPQEKPSAIEPEARKHDADLIDLSDDLATVRNLIEAAFMAVNSLQRDVSRPLSEVIYTAEQKLDEAIDALEVYRGAKETADV